MSLPTIRRSKSSNPNFLADREAAILRRKPQQHATNVARLRDCKHILDHVPFRLMAQIPCSFRHGRHKDWGSLQGESLIIRVPEAVDIWALWADVVRFIRAWRPARVRSVDQQRRVGELLTEWDRLGASVKINS